MLSNKKITKLWITLFFLAFIFLGFYTVNDYGMPWDELSEIDILKSNLAEYSVRFTNDVPFWLKDVPLISESIEKDHGISLFYPYVLVLMQNDISEIERHLYWNMLCWIVFSLGSLGLFGILRQLDVPWYFAIFGCVLLLLTPRFFAEGHYNNKDIALFSLTLLTTWQALRLIKKPTLNATLWFAIFGAFAFNTKIVGGAIWGMCFIAICIRLFYVVRSYKKILGILSLGLLTFLAVFVLITPASWSNPLDYFKYLLENALHFSRWNGFVLYRGQIYNLLETTLPRSYLPFTIFVTIPLWLWVCFAIGVIFSIIFIYKNKTNLLKNSKSISILLLMCLWFIPIISAFILNAKVYNGWRHFYFIYGPMLVFMGYGIFEMYIYLKTKRFFKNTIIFALIICSAFFGINIWKNHPYQYVYYQPYVQYLNSNSDYMELDYWNISARDALLDLAKISEGDIVISGVDIWTKFALEYAVNILPNEYFERIKILPPEEKNKADYLLVNPTYANYGNKFVITENNEKIINITAYGQSIMQIYKNKK